MGKSSGSKADTAVKLVMIFFISLLSFSVGTYVGKQVSDSESRRANLETDFNGGEHGATATAEAAHGEADASTQPITDEEVASLTEEFIKKEERNVASEDAQASGDAHSKDEHAAKTEGHGNAHADDGYTHHSKIKATGHEDAMNDMAAAKEAHHTAPAADAHATAKDHAPAKTAPAKPVAAAHGVEKAADRVAHDMAPAADPKKVREPSATLPTVATTAIGKYTVQVASYATEGEAKDQAAKLTGKGYSAFYIPANVNGKTWYRVSVGLFSDQKSATNYRTELLATQAVASAIVQKIVK